MKRLILEIKSLKIKPNPDFFEILATGSTRSQPYKDPILIQRPSIPEKDQVKELVFEFYANSDGAIFQAIGSIDVKKTISKKEYSMLETITVIAETNEASVKV